MSSLRSPIIPASILLITTVLAPAAAEPRPAPSRSDIVLVTIDTLRADRMSGYGYSRPTSPNLDDLFRRGVQFTQARTIEPLTSPALCSMITSRPPHEHGSTRNGLRMRPGLDSLPKELRYHGYRTAAFVGSWTLRDKLSGLSEHFDEYQEVLTRRRWFGLVRSEATAEDLNDALLDWVRAQREEPGGRPLFLWIHYVEPHAPYRLWKDFAAPLGIRLNGNVPAADRYDTEIACIDSMVGDLLGKLSEEKLLRDPMILFAADHGESLGDHNYWGHGRHLYEATLRIPMSITWEGHLRPGKVHSPALLTDLAPTVLKLLGLDSPRSFQGFDWTGVMEGREAPPEGRITRYQAHRGAVLSNHQSDLARRSGLLELGLIDGDLKEIYRLEKGQRRLFDLSTDPTEKESLTRIRSTPSETLQAWMNRVTQGLASFDELPAEPLDEESAEKLKALGYLE